MNKFLPQFLTIIVSICLFSPVRAADDEPNWYQIEVIVFANKNPQAPLTEHWPEKPPVSPVETYIELISADPNLSMEIWPEPAGAPNTMTDQAESAMIKSGITDQQEADQQRANPGMAEPDFRDPDFATSSEPQVEERVEKIIPFGVLDKEQYRLTVSAEKLENSSNYDLLLHVSWRQPVFSSKNNSAVFLHDKINEQLSEEIQSELKQQQDAMLSGNSASLDQTAYLDNVDTDANLDFSSGPALVPERHDAGNPVGPEPQRFFGAFKLSLSRFLHIDIDMIYRSELTTADANASNDEEAEPGSAPGKNQFAAFLSQDIRDETSGLNQLETKPQDFRMVASRRIKSDEIHYFDHPAFGVVTMISRYEFPDKEEEAVMQPFIP